MSQLAELERRLAQLEKLYRNLGPFFGSQASQPPGAATDGALGVVRLLTPSLVAAVPTVLNVEADPAYLRIAFTVVAANPTWTTVASFPLPNAFNRLSVDAYLAVIKANGDAGGVNVRVRVDNVTDQATMARGPDVSAVTLLSIANLTPSFAMGPFITYDTGGGVAQWIEVHTGAMTGLGAGGRVYLEAQSTNANTKPIATGSYLRGRVGMSQALP